MRVDMQNVAARNGVSSTGLALVLVTKPTNSLQMCAAV